jgi:hypothetical protein
MHMTDFRSFGQASAIGSIRLASLFLRLLT